MTASTNSMDNDGIIDEDDCYYFESDHLALKGNKDYSETLKTLFLLEAQRCRLLNDYETMVKLRNKSLEDPLEFVRKLKLGEELNVPESLHIADVPKINWSKFNVRIPENLLEEIRNENVDEHVGLNNKLIKDTTKSKRHHWTVDEQKRLEELLIQFPPEEVELHRFRKIANALGNRTVQQVCSRVQKYFIKLHSMGLPIPGRIPKSINKKKSHKHQRHNHYLSKPSTFFPELNIPVTMSDEIECPGPSNHTNNNDDGAQQNYLLPTAYADENKLASDKSDYELQLDLLRRAKIEKTRHDREDYAHQHVDFKCDYCNEEPIRGSRWHCATCTSSSVDFCTDCLVAQLYSDGVHPLNHKFVVYRNDGNFSSGNELSDSSSGDDEDDDDEEEDDDGEDDEKNDSDDEDEDDGKPEDVRTIDASSPINGASNAVVIDVKEELASN